MKQATLCFLIKEEENQIKEICLALKKRGFGVNRWNGFGGKVKEGETIEQAMERETEEESRVDIKDFYKVAELSFFFPHCPDWDQTVHVYFCKNWVGEPQESEEMNPKWFLVKNIPFNDMWQDDIHWLPEVINRKLVRARFSFDKEDKIIDQKVKIVDSLLQDIRILPKSRSSVNGTKRKIEPRAYPWDSMIKLAEKTVIYIVPTRPFHFDSTFFKPGHFPSKDMKWAERGGKRWQTMLFRGERLGTVFENAGTAKNPKVKIVIYSQKKLSSEFIGSVKNEVIWRYNLGLDLSEFYKEVAKNRLLAPVIKKFKGLRPMCPGSLYEYLIIAIVLQNAPVRRSVYMMQTLFENYGTLLEFAGEKLWCFWEPRTLAKADEKKLRDLKMGYRAKSLIKVSQSLAFYDQKISENTKNKRSRENCNFTFDEFKLRNSLLEKQEAALLSLYGIGPASVGYIMFDVFHQWDFLKHISPWEQKIYNKIFFNKDWEKELVSVEKMLKHFNRWGKWKNLAVHYIWENIWWQRRNKHIPWLEKLIRL